MKRRMWVIWGSIAVVLSLLVPVETLPAASAESDSKNLPGLQTGAPPWGAETENLRSRLKAINLPALSQEGNALHIHQHLDIFVHDKRITIPADIGINYDERFISPLHTHDRTGVIHVEADEVRDFTIGQFFDVWGVRFTKDCIGGYCAKGNDKLHVFANGKPVSGDPRALVLTAHQEIAVVYGPEKTAVSIPSHYDFDPGL